MITIRDAKGDRILACKKEDCGSENIELTSQKRISMVPPEGMYQLVVTYNCTECRSQGKYTITKAEIVEDN